MGMLFQVHKLPNKERPMRRTISLILLLCLTNLAVAEDGFPSFEAKVLDANIGKVCYAVTLADVNGDKKQDIVAVSDTRVLWYENPSWKSRVIISEQTPKDNVCIAPMDIDGDGKIDFALGAGWTGTGTIHWLRRSASIDDPWEVHQIGAERWLHRMRFADVLGKGRAQLVISPLNATVGNGARLTAFEIPKDPVKERWQPTVLNGEFNRMHNHWHVDFDGKDAIDTLTASREGIHLVRRTADGWSKTKIGTGAAAASPNQSGAGEVKTGRLKNGTTFVTTVEPMHGTQLVVYTPSDKKGELWNRHVVDKGFVRGHALWTADIDGDGNDEIVFGHSDTPKTHGVIVYDAVDDSLTKWDKHVVDAGGMATEDLIVADLTGDGRPDIVAGGRSTRNVKLYVNKK
jgi:hypothetical protein